VGDAATALLTGVSAGLIYPRPGQIAQEWGISKLSTSGIFFISGTLAKTGASSPSMGSSITNLPNMLSTKLYDHSFFRMVHLRMINCFLLLIFLACTVQSGLILKTGDMLQAASAWPALLFGMVSHGLPLWAVSNFRILCFLDLADIELHCMIHSVNTLISTTPKN